MFSLHIPPLDGETSDDRGHWDPRHCRIPHLPSLHHLHGLHVRQRGRRSISTTTRGVWFVCVYTAVCGRRHGVHQCGLCQCRGAAGSSLLSVIQTPSINRRVMNPSWHIWSLSFFNYHHYHTTYCSRLPYGPSIQRRKEWGRSSRCEMSLCLFKGQPRLFSYY